MTKRRQKKANEQLGLLGNHEKQRRPVEPRLSGVEGSKGTRRRCVVVSGDRDIP
jgi:hypothetical protein